MAVTLRFSRAAASILVVAVATIMLAGPAPAGQAANTRRAAAPPAWVWPVSPPQQVQRAFEAPPTPYAAGHRGIDVTAARASTVVAAADGVVTFAGMVVDRPVVSVRHEGGLVSSVEPVSATVPEGAVVQAGDPVGVVASGGHCDGRCVHFGVRLFGEYVNPMALLASLERAVLLPLGR